MRLLVIVVFVIVVFVIVAFDQGSKAWARGLPTQPPDCGVAALADHHCAGVPQSVVDGYWDWELAENRGAAFSTFVGGQIVLAVIAAGALVAIWLTATRTRPDQRRKRLALALVAGGALGNLVDRVRDGAVTDFVRWHVHGHMWPIFNLADAALLVGVAILLGDGLVRQRTVPATA